MDKLRNVSVAALCALLLATVLVSLPLCAAYADEGRNLREVREELTGLKRISELRSGAEIPETVRHLPSNEYFTLVPADHWAYPALKHLSDQGLIDGYPSGFFKGDRPLTRYEFAQAMSRLLPVAQTDQEAQLAALALRTEFTEELRGIEARLEQLAQQVEYLKQRMGQVASDNDSVGTP